ncbi:MAG: tetratricopeptide (TPR) repeat protein [Verrucomicrobiales bacterium]|jgi:tetratricopeptide (TPR) repeat protein
MKTHFMIFAMLITAVSVHAQRLRMHSVESLESRFENSDGKDLKALRTLLLIFESQQEFEEADKWIKHRQELVPDKPSGWLLEARNLHLQQKSAEALEILQETVDRFGGQMLAEAEANFRGRLGQTEQAWTMIWAIYDEAESREEWLRGLSAIRQIERDEEELIAKLGKRRPSARNLLSMAQITRRTHPDPYLERAMELEPANPEVWLEHALFFEYDGQIDEARTAWERAVELDGGLEAEAGLARFFLATGEIEEGKPRVRELLESGRITPALAPGLINELLDLGEWILAIEILENTIPMSSNPWTGEAALAVLLSESGNRPASIKLAESAKASLPIRDRSDRFFGYHWDDPIRGGYWHQPQNFARQPRGQIYNFDHQLLWQPTAPLGSLLDPGKEISSDESSQDPLPIIYAVDADPTSIFALDDHGILLDRTGEISEAGEAISLVRGLVGDVLTAESASQKVGPLESISPEIANAARAHFSPAKKAAAREIARFGAICELTGAPDEAAKAYRKVLNEFPDDDIVRIRLVHSISPENADLRGKILSELDLAKCELIIRAHVERNFTENWLHALTACLSQDLPENPPDYLFGWLWSRAGIDENISRTSFRALNEAMLRHPNLAHFALLSLMGDPEAEPKPTWWNLAVAANPDGFPDISVEELQAQLSNRLGQPDKLKKLSADWDGAQQLLATFYHGEASKIEAEITRQLALDPSEWDAAEQQAKICELALRAAEFRGLEIDFSVLFLEWKQNRTSIFHMTEPIGFWLQKLEAEERSDDAVSLLSALWRRRLGEIETWEDADETDQRVFRFAEGLTVREAKEKIARLPSDAPFFQNLRRNLGLDLTRNTN